MIDLPVPALIGVIHLPPLPGSPGHILDMEEIVSRAIADAETLQGAGFDGCVVENFGDTPFSSGSLAPASLAAMAVVADAVRRSTTLRIGINALRNDAQAALGIAVAAQAMFIRVNVHTGVYATDQGWLGGQADQTLRYRKLLGARTAIFADVHVKHATPISEPDIALAAKDTAYRGMADALIVTGVATGQPTKIEELTIVKEAVPDRRLFVGSGATIDTVSELIRVGDGVIVGTGIKPNGDTSRPIDAEIARSFARAAGRSD